MLRAALLPVFLLLSSVAVFAQDSGRIDRLYDALGMAEVVEIMRAEGIDYSEELAGELFQGTGGDAWAELIDEIYALPRLEEIVRSALARELEGADTAPMVAFFESPLGRRVIRLENSARRTLLDPDVDAASRAALAEMIDNGDPRLELIETFAEVNDLIESNVAGAMNSNYAFYQGLSDGGAFGRGFTEQDMLADVWSQEDTIRAETIDWLYSYLAMAYRPLTDDEMFVSVSLALGHAAARFISSEEL